MESIWYWKIKHRKWKLNENSMENYFFGELNEVIKEFYQNIVITYYPTLSKYTKEGNDKVVNILKKKYTEIQNEYDDYFNDVKILNSLDEAKLYAKKLNNYYYYFEKFNVDD